MTDCDYCDGSPLDYCTAREPRHGFICTRETGHDGPHVACIASSGTRYDDHEVAEWTDDDLEKYSDDEFTSTGVSDA